VAARPHDYAAGTNGDRRPVRLARSNSEAPLCLSVLVCHCGMCCATAPGILEPPTLGCFCAAGFLDPPTPGCFCAAGFPEPLTASCPARPRTPKGRWRKCVHIHTPPDTEHSVLGTLSIASATLECKSGHRGAKAAGVGGEEPRWVSTLSIDVIVKYRRYR